EHIEPDSNVVVRAQEVRIAVIMPVPHAAVQVADATQPDREPRRKLIILAHFAERVFGDLWAQQHELHVARNLRSPGSRLAALVATLSRAVMILTAIGARLPHHLIRIPHHRLWPDESWP